MVGDLMIIRNETFVNGACIAAEVIDLTQGTIAREVNGAIVSTRALTPAEVAANTPPVDVRAELLARLDGATILDEVKTIVSDAITAGVL